MIILLAIIFGFWNKKISDEYFQLRQSILCIKTKASRVLKFIGMMNIKALKNLRKINSAAFNETTLASYKSILWLTILSAFDFDPASN